MILRYLKLENIRSYLNEKIEFPEGSVLLSGDIGAGKSTILLGIEFALFGIMRAELSGASLLRHGTNSGSVELCFEIGKDEYLIKRILKRSRDAIVQDAGYLLINGRKIEGTPVELKAKILGILGYPEELLTRSKSMIYRYTVYTPQEEMKQILFEDKDARLDTLRKLFGIDKYKNIRENSVIFIRELKKKKTELSVRLEQREELAKEKEQKHRRLEAIEPEIGQEESVREKIRLEIDAAAERLHSIEDRKKRYDDLKKNMAVAEARFAGRKLNSESLAKRIDQSRHHISLLETRLSGMASVKEAMPEEEEEKKLLALQEKISAQAREAAMHSEKIKAAGVQISRLESEIRALADISKQMIVLELKLKETEERLQMLPGQQALLDELREKEKKQLATLEGIGTRISDSDQIIRSIRDAESCPTCGQDLDDKHRQEVVEKEQVNIRKCQEDRKKALENIEKIRSNIDKVERNIEKLLDLEKSAIRDKANISNFRESSAGIVDKQKELASFYEKKRESESTAAALVPESALKEKLSEHRDRIAKIRDNNLRFREKKNVEELIGQEKRQISSSQLELEQTKKELSVIDEEKKGIMVLLGSHDGIMEEYEKEKANHDALNGRLKSTEIRIASLTQEKKMIGDQAAEIGKKLETLDAVEAKIKGISELQAWFEELFLNLMITMEKHIMISLHKEFSSFLREWFSLLVGDLTISLDDTFSVIIMQDGYETSIESLSGGEKTSVALAYRLALNRVINDLIPTIRTKDLIILDEPTDGFSNEQLDRVREVFEELNMKQTIIVSHEPKMETFVDNIIRISKAQGISRAEIIR